MTAPILKLRATKTPKGFPLLSIGEWLIETVDMRASDVGDALGAIGGDAGLAQMVAIAPQLGLTVARLTAERDDALSLLIEEQQARHAAGTRVAQLEGLLREAQQWVVEEPGVTMAGAAEALDDRINAALGTVAEVRNG